MPNYNTIYDRTTKQWVWWVERDSIGIALHDPMEEQKDQFASPIDVRKITLFYHKKADHFNTLDSNSSSMAEQSEIPLQFHQYLVDRAIQLGYETKPDMIQMAPYFEKKFEKGIKEGKMFANRGRISGVRHVKQSSF